MGTGVFTQNCSLKTWARDSAMGGVIAWGKETFLAENWQLTPCGFTHCNSITLY